MNQKIQKWSFRNHLTTCFDIENAKKLLESFEISKQDVEGEKKKLN